MKERRTSITVPVVMDNEIQKYMEQTGIKTWNSALWELVRSGLDAKKKDHPSQ